MPKKAKKTAGPETVPVKYEAAVGLVNDKTGRSYEPGEVVVAGEDFGADTLEHWAETGRVVRLNG